MTSQSSPERCFVLMPGQPRGHNVAVCERGRIGVRMTGVDLGEADEAWITVNALNAALGVSPSAQREMVECALHGWSSRLAEPRVCAATRVLH